MTARDLEDFYIFLKSKKIVKSKGDFANSMGFRPETLSKFLKEGEGSRPISEEFQKILKEKYKDEWKGFIDDRSNRDKGAGGSLEDIVRGLIVSLAKSDSKDSQTNIILVEVLRGITGLSREIASLKENMHNALAALSRIESAQGNIRA